MIAPTRPATSAGRGERGRRGDGQARDPRCRRARVPGQPLRPALRGRGPTAARRARRHARADRPHLPHERRIRMGPFELMDLVGIDVGFEVAKSFAELSFGEPRWRPSPIQARMVAAGGASVARPAVGSTSTATARTAPRIPRHRRPAAATAPRSPCSARVRSPPHCASGPAAPSTTCARAVRGADRRRPGDPRRLAARRRSAARAVRIEQPRGSPRARRRRLPPAASLRRPGGADAHRLDAAVRRRRRRGVFRPARLRLRVGGRRPGLVLGRIVCQLVNEAWFAVGEGVGSQADVDTGLCAASTTRAGRSVGARRSASIT